MSATKLLKSPFILIPLVAGVLLPCAALLIVRFSRPANPQSSALVLKDAVVISGKPLPTTDLLALDGKKVPPDVLRKGKVLLVFLTTHCEPCQKEFKLLSSVQSETSLKIKIYGVGVEDKSLINDFIQQNEVKTEIVLDQRAELMKSLSVKYFPTSFLVEDGVIVKTWFGNSASRTHLLEHLGF